jgi:hypothetical protein
MNFTIAGALISTTAIVWLLVDVFLYVNKKETISQAIIRMSWYTPMVPFIFGFLCGHWFW